MSSDCRAELRRFVYNCTIEECGEVLRLIAGRLEDIREPDTTLTPEERTMPPIDAVKSIRSRLGVSLVTAKAIWDRR